MCGCLFGRDTGLQELPLLEAELDVRPDLSGHLQTGDKKPLDLKHKVRWWLTSRCRRADTVVCLHML